MQYFVSHRQSCLAENIDQSPGWADRGAERSTVFYLINCHSYIYHPSVGTEFTQITLGQSKIFVWVRKVIT
jgi:hypothetical protein